MFDPNKHRKTAAKLATLINKKPLSWVIQKPKKKDYIRVYGNSIEDLSVVNIFDQRDGAGEEKLWLIQGKDEAEEDAIINSLKAEDILTAIVAPCYVKANKQIYIWLAKQGSAALVDPHPVHLQIKDCIIAAQKGWHKIYWDKTSKQYLSEPPENTEIFGEPVWPDPKKIQEHLEKSFKDRIIETADHDVVQRTLGLKI